MLNLHPSQESSSLQFSTFHSSSPRLLNLSSRDVLPAIYWASCWTTVVMWIHTQNQCYQRGAYLHWNLQGIYIGFSYWKLKKAIELQMPTESHLDGRTHLTPLRCNWPPCLLPCLNWRCSRGPPSTLCFQSWHLRTLHPLQFNSPLSISHSPLSHTLSDKRNAIWKPCILTTCDHLPNLHTSITCILKP